jgi:uncharacterized protein (DUF1778 family)
MPKTKGSRFEARLNADDDALLSWAARQLGTSKSSFVVGAALDRARELRDRERVTTIVADQVEAFADWLESPPAVPSGMEKLARSEPFERR